MTSRAVVHLNAPRGEPLPGPLLAKAVSETLSAEGHEAGEISLTLLDDEAIRELNRRYLGRDRPTDVISFALNEPDEPPLGDVYVGLEQARRQAAEEGVALEEELVRLVVHGTLHVLGHEHPEDAEARAASDMYRRQEKIVGRLTRRGGAR